MLEDQLRTELIDQGKQMNELRAEHEQAVQDLTQKLSQKSEAEVTKLQLQNKEQLQQLKVELIQKDEKIKAFEKNEKKNHIEREKTANQQEQFQLLQESLKNTQTDRDLIEKQKLQLQETVKTKEGIISDLRTQIKDLETMNINI